MRDIATVTLNNQSTPNDQNYHQHYSLVVASPASRLSDIAASSAATTTQTSASTLMKPDGIASDPLTLSVLSADIDDIVQHALHVWKNDALALNTSNHSNEILPFTNNEDLLLANILQRASTDQPNALLHPMGMSIEQMSLFFHALNYLLDNQNNIATLFRPITQTDNNELPAASGKDYLNK